jgi:gamma-glutamyltranspeptidase/glutathione hydrolase
MRNPDLARTFRALAEGACSGFYKGRVGDAIVAAVASRGGVLSSTDLAQHRSVKVTPLSAEFCGVRIHEIPPNGQGIVALMALQYLQRVAWPQGVLPPHNSPTYINAVVQALRLAFADGRTHICDASMAHVSPEQLLSPEYADKRAAMIDPARCMPVPEGGWPIASSDTVSFQTVDSAGNAVSFINSNYMGFGTGIIPHGTGFTLQNRGAGFSLERGHPNALEPGKRPYHTIIPGMATVGGQLFASFSVMGGFMQPQGHAQVVSNMLQYGMDAQAALDAPRVCLPAGTAGCTVAVESGIDAPALQGLLPGARSVHSWERSVFGRGQVIRRMPNGVLQGGSDGRGDGCAVGCGAPSKEPATAAAL